MNIAHSFSDRLLYSDGALYASVQGTLRRVLPGSTQDLGEVQTNSAGILTLKLAPGVYFIRFETGFTLPLRVPVQVSSPKLAYIIVAQPGASVDWTSTLA